VKSLVVLVVGLAVPGILPALAVARRSPAAVFLAPLSGAGMAAVAAVFELGVGGSLPANYAVVAVIANLAVVAWWVAAGRSSWRWASWRWEGLPWGWSAATVVVTVGCLAVSLDALRTKAIGWDAGVIWETHAMLVYGGHHDLFTGLRNVAYRFSNPDYPPLIPAAEALTMSFFGQGNLHLPIDTTVLLNACALGVVASGIATAAANGRQVTRAAAVAAAGALCLVGFAVSDPYGVIGYADLLWAAAAAGAVIWGLVLPRSAQALGIAWICAAVAGLTKNEGLTSALIILVLIALRYRPLSPPRRRRPTGTAPGQAGQRRTAPGWPALWGRVTRSWAKRAGFALLPALPGLAWAGIIRLIGVHDAFFKSTSGETPLYRAQATLAGMYVHLHVAPVDLGVLLVGCLLLRRDRERAGLANPAWLWISGLGALGIIFGTYVFGGLEIHGWLRFSVNRTTIFAQVLLYADLLIWLVIAVESVLSRRQREAFTRSNRPGLADGADVTDAPDVPGARLSGFQPSNSGAAEGQ
jgi:hypothetical protein